MKTKTCFFLLLLLTATKTFSQQAGFYVNDGKVKITELSCYEFDNLSVVVPILPEMKGYDWIVINIGEYAEGADNSATSLGVGYEGPVFRAKFSGKANTNILLFKKDEIKSDLDGDLTRIMMKYAVSDKGMNGGYLQVKVWGQTITGYTEEIVGNSIKKRANYSNSVTIYKSDKLALKNRTLTNRFKKAFLQKMDLSTPCNPTGTAAATESSSANPYENMPDGPYSQNYPSGNLQVTGGFKNKKPDGQWKLYYESGTLKEEEVFINGLEEGLETAYYESGKISMKTNYLLGKKSGERVYFDEKGMKVKMETYKDDQLNGPYKEWKNGKLAVTGNYINGIKDGEWKTYDANGTKVLTTEKWKDGAME